jgi:ABC-type lipoprotein release transport system permease subunit
MRLGDHLRFALTSLWKRKLRTFLTASGVMIGIGALISMVSFGRGMQKNVTESFRALDLFNTLTVLPGNLPGRGPRNADGRRPAGEPAASGGGAQTILDDAAVAKIARLQGVESAFPDIRLPALIRLDGSEELRLAQVVPAAIAGSKSIGYAAGQAYGSDDDEAVILSAALLREFGVRDPRSAVGRKLSLSTVGFDFSSLNPADLMASLSGDKLPFSTEEHELTITGVSEASPFGSSGPLQSDIFIPAGTARRINRLPFSSIWDLFRAGKAGIGYSALNVRLKSLGALEPVKKEVKAMGFGTFALADQFREIRRGFVVMDMVLAAVGMIAIVVASLGIINTMVMSILERYSEIGVMKALGARDRDVRRIFLVESGVIGFLGGAGGLALGAVVSGVINRIINYFLSRQGIPYIDYFDFSWWLCLGAVAFSVAVSLAAGVYPAMRAVRVDPVRALRHD